MPRLVDVIERDAVLTGAVLRLAGECGVAAVTLAVWPSGRGSCDGTR